MNIIYIHKDIYAKRPPVISATMLLSQLGHHVTVIDEGVNDYWKTELKDNGIDYFEIQSKGTSKWDKIRGYLNFRKEVYSFLKSHQADNSDHLLWIEGAQTILALGKGIKKYRYVLQIQELHELHKYQLRAIGKVIKDAEAVVMPEYNRTFLYQVWFKLKERPFLLPNKPYFIPSTEELSGLKDKYKDLVRLFEEKKVILYQGHIGYNRDLSAFAEAVRELGEDYRLVLMGRDAGILKKYQSINPNIVHIDFIPAPDYLLFTSLSHMGILSYNPESLNNVFCAPNKYYEYAAFGKPMLGNDIPGMRPIEISGAGKVVEERSAASIRQAILDIDSQYDAYSQAAKRFFEKTDNRKTLQIIMESILSKRESKNTKA